MFFINNFSELIEVKNEFINNSNSTKNNRGFYQHFIQILHLLMKETISKKRFQKIQNNNLITPWNEEQYQLDQQFYFPPKMNHLILQFNPQMSHKSIHSNKYRVKSQQAKQLRVQKIIMLNQQHNPEHKQQYSTRSVIFGSKGCGRKCSTMTGLQMQNKSYLNKEQPPSAIRKVINLNKNLIFDCKKMSTRCFSGKKLTKKRQQDKKQIKINKRNTTKSQTYGSFLQKQKQDDLTTLIRLKTNIQQKSCFKQYQNMTLYHRITSTKKLPIKNNTSTKYDLLNNY